MRTYLAFLKSGTCWTQNDFLCCKNDELSLFLLSQVLINISNRGVDDDAFQSISSSFLVFDNRLVINNTFSTSDASIFGAGPLTKFSLRYHTDEWSHANFSSKEVGQELAAALLRLFDPMAEAADQPSPGLDRLVPLYKQAKVQGLKTNIRCLPS